MVELPVTVSVVLVPHGDGAGQSGTTIAPALPFAAMWMCAAVAGPLSFAYVSVHFSVVPVSVALNKPCAAVTRTAWAGTSWPVESAAVQTVVCLAPSEIVAPASPATATAASSATSFLTFSSSST